MATNRTSASSCGKSQWMKADEKIGKIYGLLLSALRSFDIDLYALAAVIAVGDLGVELERHASLAQELLNQLRDLRIHPRTANLTKEFDNRDFCAETRPDGALL